DQGSGVLERESSPGPEPSRQGLALERRREKRQRTLVLRLLESAQAASQLDAQLLRRAEQLGGALGIARRQSATRQLDRPAGVVPVVRRRRDREALHRELARIFEPAGLESHRGTRGERTCLPVQLAA